MRKKDKPESQPAADPATGQAADAQPETAAAELAASAEAGDAAPDGSEPPAEEGNQADEGADQAGNAADTPAYAAEDAGDSQEDVPASPDPVETAAEPETAQLKADLLQARSKLAAYEAGVAQDKVADAVTLAMAQARADGNDVTEEAVAAAMQDVLKRNPEWKAAGGKKATGGFKLGSDPDSRPAARQGKADAGHKKPWNKFNR